MSPLERAIRDVTAEYRRNRGLPPLAGDAAIPRCIRADQQDGWLLDLVTGIRRLPEPAQHADPCDAAQDENAAARAAAHEFGSEP